jgi:hypothetical protein
MGECMLVFQAGLNRKAVSFILLAIPYKSTMLKTRNNCTMQTQTYQSVSRISLRSRTKAAVFMRGITSSCNTIVVIKLSELIASILETQGGVETETTLIASGEIPRSSWAVCLSIIASIEAVEPPKECPTSRSSYPCHHIFSEPQSFYNLKEDMLL